jgi:hypothetical protein
LLKTGFFRQVREPKILKEKSRPCFRSPLLKTGFFRQVMEAKIQRKNPGRALRVKNRQKPVE